MRMLDTGEIALTKEEAGEIAGFIRASLNRQWDDYTDTYIVENTTWEEGMRRMDPEMYDLADRLNL